MSLFAILLMAFGLSMDVFTVSIARGLRVKHNKLPLALQLAGLFGLFHVVMILFGWLLGNNLNELITGFDHWIAFGLLAFVGLKMIREGFGEEKKVGELTPFVLFLLALATSIDALAVGISFAFLQVGIVSATITIGSMAALFSFVGVFVGNKSRKICGSWTEFIGGVILIGIGVKILFEHLS